MTRGRRRVASALLSVTTVAALLVTASAPIGAGAETSSPRAPRLFGFTHAKSAWERSYEARFKRIVSAQSVSANSTRLSNHPGLIATPDNAKRIQYSVNKLRDYGLDAHTSNAYDVYISSPRRIRVSMTAPTRHVARTKERPYPWHKPWHFQDVVPGYNAYSPSGDVKDQVVYVNYGLPEDYAKLHDLGVNVTGKIAIARYGVSFRGVKAKLAEQHGATGLIIYSDPADDGYVQGPVYPRGPWRPADAFQRGSIEYIFNYPGDPLTRGRPALPGTPRVAPAKAGNLPHIPTTPLPYGDAKYLLRALRGPRAPEAWQGGLHFPYRIGPGPTEARLDLDIDYQRAPVRNVIAAIPGTKHPEKKVIIGGHYDSWTYGANDNTSAWATILEVGRSLGALLDKGWRPDRTIVLVGWGGEEYGLLGSTEWVEQLKAQLGNDAVAYLNMDRTAGQDFYGGGVPALDRLLYGTARSVKDPGDDRSVYDNWAAQFGGAKPEVVRPGSGSDYTAFLDHVGIPIIDAGFLTGGGEYHSAYDDLYWVRHFGDPGYVHQAAMARVIGTLALRLANADTLPMMYSGYAYETAGYVRGLQQLQEELYGRQRVRLASAISASNRWGAAAQRLEDSAASLVGSTNRPSERRLQRINGALMQQERDLTQRVGLAGRPWFKHMIYAPGLNTGYAVQYLPSIEDAITNGHFATARRYRDLLERSLERATRDALAGCSCGSVTSLPIQGTKKMAPLRSPDTTRRGRQTSTVPF